MRNRLVVLFATLSATLTVAGAARAHPHVWVESRSTINFGDDGAVTGITHVWRFDEGYTSYMVQGLDTNGDGVYSQQELAELAEINTRSLADFGYFTDLTIDGRHHDFSTPIEYRLEHDGEAATLTFTLPLLNPATSRTALVLQVYDPEFFVFFRMSEDDAALTLAGGPAGCAVAIDRSDNVELDQFANFSEAFFEAMTATEELGVEIVNRALVACP